ncbi:MAG: archaetidylserine decarboxylase [Candidatus Berkiellales bacterium]
MQGPFTVWRQYFLPQRFLTWAAGKLAFCQIRWFKDWAIRRFIRLYEVNVEEAEVSELSAYASFHHFFIRKLKAGLRPIDPLAEGLCSPCDGSISQIGKIQQDTLVQAKGRDFTLKALLGDESLAPAFKNGRYATIYLAPKDYHRVHMPCAGTLTSMQYIPGKLFSVNPLTANYVDQLFAKNERLVTTFTNEKGQFAIVLVGAMLVGSVFTRWGGRCVAHSNPKNLKVNYPNKKEQHITLDKGEEMGYFSLGSTVILLFPENLNWEPDITQLTNVVVGQRIGRYF